jgi:hypothetical protein
MSTHAFAVNLAVVRRGTLQAARAALMSWLLLAFLASGSAVAQSSGHAVPQASSDAATQSPGVTVFKSCSGGSNSCTTTAVCPQGMSIESGWSFYLVPDGTGAAYGICGTASAACVKGTESCSVTTAISGCGSPGWGRQTALVAITCKM